MKYIAEMGILKFSIVSVTTAIALSSTTNVWAANLTFVNSRSGLGANDFLDWSSSISSVPVPTGSQFKISSAGGLLVTGDLGGAPGEVRRQNTNPGLASNANATQNSTFWNGNFAPNDAVYWNKGEGRLSLTFATPVSSVGTQLDSLFYRDSVAAKLPATTPPSTSLFKGRITAFFGSGPLASSTSFDADGVTNALADNSAAFFGVKSDSADITRIVFDNFDIPKNEAYFNYAINRVSFGNPAAVPEPFTIFGTILGGAAALKMRKGFKVSNKL
jgi:hypothetical protein